VQLVDEELGVIVFKDVLGRVVESLLEATGKALQLAISHPDRVEQFAKKRTMSSVVIGSCARSLPL
jgi:hypothetical protein